MQIPNIKVYLAISGVVIILFLFVVFTPFGKNTSNQQQNTNNLPTPTLVEVNYNLIPTSVTSNFTGVAEEQLSKQVIDLAVQKKDLRQKTPLDLSTFTIDFDYGEDKFVVTLNDPKDQSRKEFEDWRMANYPGLSTDQFLLK